MLDVARYVYSDKMKPNLYMSERVLSHSQCCGGDQLETTFTDTKPEPESWASNSSWRYRWGLVAFILERVLSFHTGSAVV